MAELVVGYEAFAFERAAAVVVIPKLRPDLSGYILGLQPYLGHGGAFVELTLPERTHSPKPFGRFTRGPDDLSGRISIYAQPQGTRPGQAA